MSHLENKPAAVPVFTPDETLPTELDVRAFVISILEKAQNTVPQGTNPFEDFATTVLSKVAPYGPNQWQKYVTVMDTFLETVPPVVESHLKGLTPSELLNVLEWAVAKLLDESPLHEKHLPGLHCGDTVPKSGWELLVQVAMKARFKEAKDAHTFSGILAEDFHDKLNNSYFFELPYLGQEMERSLKNSYMSYSPKEWKLVDSHLRNVYGNIYVNNNSNYIEYFRDEASEPSEFEEMTGPAGFKGWAHRVLPSLIFKEVQDRLPEMVDVALRNQRPKWLPFSGTDELSAKRRDKSTTESP